MLKDLNQAQLKAVQAIDGPVMVMAGAGSGKTRVLTERITYLIQEHFVSPYQILAVTFTNKAANEMKERISKQLDIDSRFMWISTFHSFCSRLLRLEIDGRLGSYTKNFLILDEDDSVKIIKEILKEKEIEDFKPKKLKDLISKKKNGSLMTIRDPQLKKTFDVVLKLYQAYLIENNMFDFDDLLIQTIELFKKNSDLLEKYQEKFQYILVDEFQDTNDIQYQLIYMLAARYRNIFVVGDDFQSIYSFRGAKIENINQFIKDFCVDPILLEHNYRSTSQILNLANEVIKHNPNQIKKVMFSDKKNGSFPFYYQASSEKAEAMFVVDKIKKFHIESDPYQEFAVMYRTNHISRVFEDMLIKFQIPYVIYGGLSFFSRKEIKDMVAYLRVLVNPKDDFSFIRIVNEPKRKIGSSLIEKLTMHAHESGLSLFEAIPSYLGTGVGVKALKEFYTTMQSILSQIENMPLKNIIDVLLEETGYRSMLLIEDPEHERIGNIYELKNVLKETDESVEGSNVEKLESLLYDLSLRTDRDEADTKDAVVLTTYHQAKGLEFKTVFMVAMEEGIFPSEYHIDDLDIEEERRICYVGITRAKERLYLSSAATRMLYGHRDYASPSRFLKEMGTDCLKSISSEIEEKRNWVSQKPKVEATIKEEDYHVGEKIIHNVFGAGMIVGIDGNSLKVAFASPTGIKTLLKNHPSYHKMSET